MTATETLDVLALAHALIDSGWCQHAEARTKNGFLTGYLGPDAASYCVSGAVDLALWEVVSSEIWTGAPFIVYDLLHKELPPDTNLVPFNDADGQRKRGLLRLIERAAAKVSKS